MTPAKLTEKGYINVATFRYRERAETRAAIHRSQGFQARIAKITTADGKETYAVYIK